MDLIQLVVLLAVVGLVLWLVITYIPMPEPFRKVIIAVVVIVLALYLLSLFGIGSGIRVGR